ncbi:MAG: ribonuclease III [Clostridia bacterium]|nr:ribonuclease III [Clostridia bacterium]
MNNSLGFFDVDGVESKIGYEFKDKLLLRKAFTHASYAHEHNQEDNELLEFFGDTVLQFVVTEYLCNNKKGDEGALTQMRAQMVAKYPLIDAVYKLGISDYILMGNGQKKTARDDDKLFSSIYEALVAAIYIDGGMAKAKKFITKTVIKNFEQKSKYTPETGVKAVVKSKFQEYVQKNALGEIQYKLISKIGPDHSAEFTVALELNGKRLAEGKGYSKKSAEAQAAYNALNKLTAKKGR